MPSLVTHRLAGDEMLLKIKNLKLNNIITKYPEAFSIGTSGPDLFYYYKVLSFGDNKNRSKVFNFGTILHKTNVNKAFEIAFESLDTLDDKYEEMVSYLAGWLAHYAVDKITHPFVCFHAGFGSEKANNMHRRLEASIDANMLKEVYNTNIRTYKPYHILKHQASTIDAIYKMYDNVLATICKCVVGKGIIKRSLENMELSYKILHDPSGIKFNILSKFEKQPYAICGTLIKDAEKENYDVLNLKHHLWTHPCIELQVSSESFVDLYYKGIDSGILLLERFDRLINNECVIDDLLDLIKNEDYVCGLAKEQPMLYSNCIYKDEDK